MGLFNNILRKNPVAVADIQVDELISKSMNLYHNGRTLEASEVIDQALSMNPGYAPAWYSKGLMEFQREDQLNCFNKALKINPNYTDALFEKGMVYLKLLPQDLDKALIILNQVTTMNPRYDKAWYQQARCLAMMSRYPEALVACERAISIDSQNKPALFLKGDLLNNLSRYNDALEVYDQLITLNPKDNFALARKAGTLAHLGRFEEADVAIDRATELDRACYPVRATADAIFNMKLNSERNRPR